MRAGRGAGSDWSGRTPGKGAWRPERVRDQRTVRRVTRLCERRGRTSDSDLLFALLSLPFGGSAVEEIASILLLPLVALST